MNVIEKIVSLHEFKVDSQGAVRADVQGNVFYLSPIREHTFPLENGEKVTVRGVDVIGHLRNWTDEQKADAVAGCDAKSRAYIAQLREQLGFVAVAKDYVPEFDDTFAVQTFDFAFSPTIHIKKTVDGLYCMEWTLMYNSSKPAMRKYFTKQPLFTSLKETWVYEEIDLIEYSIRAGNISEKFICGYCSNESHWADSKFTTFREKVSRANGHDCGCLSFGNPFNAQ